MKKSLLIAALALVAGFATAQTTDTIVSLTPSNKNVILEEYTGVNCGYCPDGHKIANQLAAANPGRVFPINIHTGSYAAMYQTDFGTALMNQTGLTGFPSGTVNRHVFSGSSTALNRGDWSSRANTIMSQASPVNIAAEGTLDFVTRELNLTVQLYYTASSAAATNMLNVAILQDNVLGPQSGSSYNPDQVVGNQYNHQHMLRHLITGQWGETISNTTAGTFVEKHYTYTIPNMLGKSGQQIAAVLDDLKFVVFVAEGHQEILTGTEANVTIVNIPDIFPRIDEMNVAVSNQCEGEANATLKIKNVGLTPVSSMTIQYQVANGTAQTYDWQGSLAVGATTTINFPAMDIAINADQEISASVISVNGEATDFPAFTTTVRKDVYTCGGWMMLEIKTDKYGSENSFKLYGPDNSVVLQGGPFTNAVNTYQFDVEPQTIGCYRLEVKDSYGDGMGYSSGTYIKLYDADHNLIFNFPGADFESSVNFSLDVNAPVGIEDHIVNAGDIRVFPNPASTEISFEAEETISNVAIFNMQGQMVASEEGDIHSMNISNLSNGMYMLKITTPSGVSTQKIVKK